MQKCLNLDIWLEFEILLRYSPILTSFLLTYLLQKYYGYSFYIAALALMFLMFGVFSALFVTSYIFFSREPVQDPIAQFKHPNEYPSRDYQVMHVSHLLPDLFLEFVTKRVTTIGVDNSSNLKSFFLLKFVDYFFGTLLCFFRIWEV